MNEVIKVMDLQIEIMRKKNQKNLYVRVYPPEGAVAVSAPIELPDGEIRMFLLRRLPEINKIRSKMIAQLRQSKREYVSGESHYLWGKSYRLQVISEGSRYIIKKTPNKLIMTVPVDATIAKKEQAMMEWYRAELKRVLNVMFEECKKKVGVYAEDARIKKMRTRWGTCNIDKRRIWLNLQLVKKPPECLEYVVIHELVHLKEKNHTNRFYALVEECCPNWKEARKLLSEMPLDFFDKGETEIDEE